MQAKKVISALADIKRSAELEPESPFYAILLMDGDALGSHMSDITKQHSITQGLAEFTQGVPDIVRNKNGFLIYAGGDDVLAIFPLEDAIPCAMALRKHYLQCFEAKPACNGLAERIAIPTTLSGAIEFAHIKTPLTKVLKDGHRLLDDTAKDGCGRDALAIRVWKPGGMQLTWAQPWEIVINVGSRQAYLEDIAQSIQNIKDDPEQFSSRFFYKIRERFDLLNPDPQNSPSTAILSQNDALSLMAMEYLNSGQSDLSKINKARDRMNKAKDRIHPLMTQCRPVVRDKDKPSSDWMRSDRLEVDGALLVRFLVQKGVE